MGIITKAELIAGLTYVVLAAAVVTFAAAVDAGPEIALTLIILAGLVGGWLIGRSVQHP